MSLHRPPGARSSWPVPRSPPTLARSGHPVVCHAARRSRRVATARAARRAARQPTAWPSARPTGAVAAPARSSARFATYGNGSPAACTCPNFGCAGAGKSIYRSTCPRLALPIGGCRVAGFPCIHLGPSAFASDRRYRGRAHAPMAHVHDALPSQDQRHGSRQPYRHENEIHCGRRVGKIASGGPPTLKTAVL